MGLYSSDEIWRGDDPNTCITDDLDQIESDIAALQTGKAPVNHTHTEYAAANHEHTGYALTGHTHTEYASSSHSHEQSEINGLVQALANKAAATHDHTLSQIVGLIVALAAKADLVDGKIPSAQLPSFVDDVLEYAAVSGFPTTGEAGKIYVATDTNKTYRWSGSAYVEISESIALGETASTAYRGDRGKTAYEHSQDSSVHVTTAQKTSWDSKAAGDHTHTPESIGAAAASHTHDYAASDHTHTPASIGAAAADHTHAAQIITAHMSPNTYTVTVNDDYINVPLDSTVTAGNALTFVNHKIRIGAGVSKVLISAQLCIASGNADVNRYIAIRKNTDTQLARAQLKLSYVTLPQTMAIANLLVNVEEGDLLSLDFYGKANDIIYGNNVLTFLTVQKIA